VQTVNILHATAHDIVSSYSYNFLGQTPPRMDRNAALFQYYRTCVLHRNMCAEAGSIVMHGSAVKGAGAFVLAIQLF
jgi:hypothetical protein